jgi:hypothetical protein
MAFAILFRIFFARLDVHRSPISAKFIDILDMRDILLFLIAYVAAPIPSAKRELIVLFMLYHLDIRVFILKKYFLYTSDHDPQIDHRVKLMSHLLPLDEGTVFLFQWKAQ